MRIYPRTVSSCDVDILAQFTNHWRSIRCNGSVAKLFPFNDGSSLHIECGRDERGGTDETGYERIIEHRFDVIRVVGEVIR